jgi:hypothetical protein
MLLLTVTGLALGAGAAAGTAAGGARAPHPAAAGGARFAAGALAAHAFTVSHATISGRPATIVHVRGSLSQEQHTRIVKAGYQPLAGCELLGRGCEGAGRTGPPPRVDYYCRKDVDGPRFDCISAAHQRS